MVDLTLNFCTALKGYRHLDFEIYSTKESDL